MHTKKRLAWVTVTMALVSTLCCAERPASELPMYGSAPLSTEIQEINDQFIRWAVQEFGTREKASRDAATRAWRCFYENDLSTAMKRFNQAWLLNTNNAEAYQGFGDIMGRRSETEDTEHNLKESIRFLEIANQKAPKNARIMTDLALSHTMLGAVLRQPRRPAADDEFAKAQALLEVAAKIEPSYPLLHYNWSVLEFYRGNYIRAKARLDEAERLGFTPAPEYLKDLNRLKDEDVSGRQRTSGSDLQITNKRFRQRARVCLWVIGLRGKPPTTDDPRLCRRRGLIRAPNFDAKQFAVAAHVTMRHE
jgi:hypothetical protein